MNPALVACCVFAVYSAGIWAYHVPLTGDQKTYIAIAMEMYRAKSWAYPILFGEHSYFKPPFQYWATLVGWHLFGFNWAGTYLPSVFAAAGTAYFLQRVSQRMGRGTAYAGIWFAACAGTLTFGLSAQMEIWLVFFYVGAWASALAWLERGRRSWLILALLQAGALSLVKSPLYSVLWVLGFWLFLVLERRWRAWRDPWFWLAHLAGIALGASWFAYVYMTDYSRFWSQYVQTETFAKRFGNGSTPLHMWLDFSTFFFPVLLPAAAALVIFLSRELLSRRTRFLIAGCLIPALFFTSFPYRTETYLYPLLPFFLLPLDWMDGAFDRSRAFRWITGVNGVIIFVAAVLGALLLHRSAMLPGTICLVLGLAGAGVLAASLAGGARALAFSSLAVILVLRVGISVLGENDVRGLRQLVEREPARALAFYDPGKNIWHEASLLSVAMGKFSERAFDPESAARAVSDGAYLVLSDDQWPALLPQLEQKVRVPASTIQAEKWLRWKRGFAVPSLRDLSPDELSKQHRQYEVVSLGAAKQAVKP